MATLKGKAIRTKDVELRDTFWPDAAKRIWDRGRHDGYATVPKTMPMLMRALDELSKGKPLGATYFALWCAPGTTVLSVWADPPTSPTPPASPGRAAFADGRSG